MLPIDLCFSSHFQHTKMTLLANQALAYTEPIVQLPFYIYITSQEFKMYIYTGMGLAC